MNKSFTKVSREVEVFYRLYNKNKHEIFFKYGPVVIWQVVVKEY